MRQLGIRIPNGEIVVDPAWTSMGALMKGLHGWGNGKASDLGVPVEYIDDEWKEIEL